MRTIYAEQVKSMLRVLAEERHFEGKEGIASGILEAKDKIDMIPTADETCKHDYFCCSQTDPKSRVIDSVYGKREYFKIATLVCRRCGETKQIEIDKYT